MAIITLQGCLSIVQISLFQENFCVGVILTLWVLIMYSELAKYISYAWYWDGRKRGQAENGLLNIIFTT